MNLKDIVEHLQRLGDFCMQYNYEEDCLIVHFGSKESLTVPPSLDSHGETEWLKYK